MAPRISKKLAAAKVTSTAVAKKVTKKLREPVVDMHAIEVSDDFAFWAIDGQVFHSLPALMKGFKVMTGRVYRYHADSEYQDFAKWISEVIGDTACAKKIAKAKTPTAAHAVLMSHSAKALKK